MKISDKIEELKFNRKWYSRNIDYADIIIDSLELDPIFIDQYLLIKNTDSLMDKLDRIGFTKLNKYPNRSQFKDIFVMMYNDKYNVALSVYDTKDKQNIVKAYNISNIPSFSSDYKLSVFISAIDVLTNEK